MTSCLKSVLAAIGVLHMALQVTAQDGRVVKLSLTTDRSAYYVGESIRVALTAKNETEETTTGYFQLAFRNERLSLYYRRVGDGFRVVPRERIARVDDAVLAPMPIGPQQEGMSKTVVLLDHAKSGFLLDRVGDYEFYAEGRPWWDKPATVIRSDVVRVSVEQPPDRHKDSLAEYVEGGLGRVVEGTSDAYDPVVIADAAAFLDRFPAGPYFDHVRTGLRRILRYRVVQGRASPTETQLYERLRAADTAK